MKKKIKKPTYIKYMQIDSSPEKLDEAFNILFEETLKDNTDNFKKGDILLGSKREFDEAYHYIIFISGSKEVPNGVILTSKKRPCNFKLMDKYQLSKDKPIQTSYFVAHLIEKMPEWGLYKKTNKKLSDIDLNIVESHINGATPVTWFQYLKYTKNGCPEHKKALSN